MAYKYETQYNSPNFTPASQASATWGQPRTIKAIAIHWWGDPNTGPTYEGVIATLCNPNRGASAHFVATGTGRRVACLVDTSNASWATNSANPWTISIECDPRCRPEDYDVVAELIASIRSAYGDLPLVPHKQFVATACPGNYDLTRLDQLARTKDGSGDWGDVKDKVVAPVKQTVPGYTKLSEGHVWLRARLDKVELWDLDSNPNYVSKQTFNKGDVIKVGWFISMNNTQYYVTDYSQSKGFKWGVNRADVDIFLEDPNTPKPTEPTTPTTQDPTVPPVTPESPPKDGFNESDRNILKSIQSALEWLVERFKSIFK